MSQPNHSTNGPVFASRPPDPLNSLASPARPSSAAEPQPTAPSPPPSSSPPRAQPSTLKRKTPPTPDAEAEAEEDDEEDRKPLVLLPGAELPASLTSNQGERLPSRVLCAACGVSVSLRDPQAGTFSVRPWEAHCESCPHAGATAQNAHHETALSYPAPLSNGGPPLKRRRAKRTEEERIAYLRSDVHIAQFEAYRVLCASCDKWIRLRPNSTYCSIPWDAHRKGCLAKKAGAAAAAANAPRPPLPTYPSAYDEITRDSVVRRVEPDRVLCGICENAEIARGNVCGAGSGVFPFPYFSKFLLRALTFLDVPPFTDGLRFLPTTRRPLSRYGMRTETRVRKQPPRFRHPEEQAQLRDPRPMASNARLPRTQRHRPRSKVRAPSTAPGRAAAACASPLPDAPHLVLDLSPSNYAAPHESRRRNAEQRAATLRADVLIRAVEPNRVFCSLCTKWVQLRQDSSFCAYPWLQHRGKCLARYQRRAQKAADAPGAGAKAPASSQSQSQGRRLVSGPGGSYARGEDEVESEEGAGIGNGNVIILGDVIRARRPPPAHPPRSLPGYSASWAAAAAVATGKPGAAAHAEHGHGHAQGQNGDADADGEVDDVDADGDSYMEDDAPPPLPPPQSSASRPPIYASASVNGGSASTILRRTVPTNLADLDSPTGRRNFVWAAVDYLYRTTHEASDDLSISALLTYVNAAMPTDKHEDFDMVECVRAATQLCASRERPYKLEGDMIRVVGHGHGDA
ncbi:hypothetical protein MKEN_00930800 [Mycena kentingensis (nom. inval.)]|nr:hypothetical protein MKEN_00930800 [Mycena kentingensis (nom. inval.)]